MLWQRRTLPNRIVPYSIRPWHTHSVLSSLVFTANRTTRRGFSGNRFGCSTAASCSNSVKPLCLHREAAQSTWCPGAQQRSRVRLQTHGTANMTGTHFSKVSSGPTHICGKLHSAAHIGGTAAGRKCPSSRDSWLRDCPSHEPGMHPPKELT